MSKNPNLRYMVVGYGGHVIGYCYSLEQAQKAVRNLRGYVNIIDQWK